MEAQSEFETALRNDPKFFYAYRPLIQLYINEGKKEQAKALYEQFLNYSQGN